MSAAAAASPRVLSPLGGLANWGRQAVDSFVAAQRIVLELTAQQNALVIGLVRERFAMPLKRPDKAIAKMADRGVTSAVSAGKIMLDLAATESGLFTEGLKEGLRLPAAAAAMADLLRYRVETLIDLQKWALDTAAEKTHAVAESYCEGEGLKAGKSVSELAHEGLETFVETEKKFLDKVVEEVTIATEADNGRKSTRDRTKVITKLAREGVDELIAAQKKLLALAIEQIETPVEVEEEPVEEVKPELRASLAELTQKSVQNLVTAQKSLMEIAVKPMKAAPRTTEHRTAPRRPRRKKA